METLVIIYLLSVVINLCYITKTADNNKELAESIVGSFTPLLNSLTAIVIVYLEFRDWALDSKVKWYKS